MAMMLNGDSDDVADDYDNGDDGDNDYEDE